MKCIEKERLNELLKEEFPNGYAMSGWIYDGWYDVSLFDITNIQHKITMYYKPYGTYYKIKYLNGSTI